MRTKSIAAIVMIALIGVIAVSVIGQEEPLPVVTPKARPDLAAIPLGEPTIVLASEPIREYQPPTLADAARHNDFITFDALYAAAKRRGEDVSQFDALHELWSYSISDPIGAFYGTDLYARLSRAYPGYAAYIEPFRVIDDRGNAFYPTSETRAFLLARALEGRPAPRVLVAETRTTQRTVPQVAERTVARRPLPAASPAPTNVAKNPAAVPAQSQPSIATRPEQASASSEAAEAAAAPPVVAHTEPVAVAQQAEPLAVAPTPKSVTSAPVSEPVVITAAEPAPAKPTAASRGILLMVIGLIGVGLLALVLRAPREEPVTIIRNAAVNNVEPMRKSPAAPANDTRATGSHG